MEKEEPESEVELSRFLVVGRRPVRDCRSLPTRLRRPPSPSLILIAVFGFAPSPSHSSRAGLPSGCGVARRARCASAGTTSNEWSPGNRSRLM